MLPIFTERYRLPTEAISPVDTVQHTLIEVTAGDVQAHMYSNLTRDECPGGVDYGPVPGVADGGGFWGLNNWNNHHIHHIHHKHTGHHNHFARQTTGIAIR